ncbi:helix-turn-helix domain-containing protein [Streptomyces sp. NPDC092952]|uniref:helix-turn-helix domain-containing protein n=1 Tax=Streptomyces sp. NPDC092952 TaxID=3366018 RepID=UPI003825BAE4
MISVFPDAGTLSRVRLALSPAHDVVSLLRYAMAGRRHPLLGDPGPAARWALRRPDVALIAWCQPDERSGLTYMPDLLTPLPSRGPSGHVFDEQLAAMDATPEEDAAHQVATVRFGGGPLPAALRSALDSGEFGQRVANGMRQFWTDAVADDWTGLRTALEADVAMRSREMAGHGIGHLLDTLHPKIGWSGGRIDVHRGVYEEEIRLADREVVLVPTIHPDVGVQLEASGDFALFYPAAGLGAVADRPRTPAVGKLLGRSRAALLGDLDVARSTGELAERLRLAPATVSYHLGVLHRSGLVLRERDRRVVRYRRSPEGDALVGRPRGTSGDTRSAARAGAARSR